MSKNQKPGRTMNIILNAIREYGTMTYQELMDVLCVNRAIIANTIERMREMLSVQGWDGNWNHDLYMHGMYNGMEYMLAMVEGRDPEFRSAPEKWIAAPSAIGWRILSQSS